MIIPTPSQSTNVICLLVYSNYTHILIENKCCKVFLVIKDIRTY